LERRQGHLGLERCRVSLPRTCHLFPLSWTAFSSLVGCPVFGVHYTRSTPTGPQQRSLDSTLNIWFGDGPPRASPGSQRHFGAFFAFPSAWWISFSRAASMAFSPGLPTHLERITPRASRT